MKEPHAQPLKDQPLRVLELIARLNIGGPAVVVLDLAAGLDQRRFRVEVAAGRVGPGEAQMDFWAEARGIKWTHVPGLSPELGAGNATALVFIRRLLCQRTPDVLHTHTAKAGTLGRLAALGLGPDRPRKIHTFHGHIFSGYFSPLKSRMFLTVERALARVTDRVVVLSQEQAEEIGRTYRVCPPHKIVVIPIGLDLKPFQKATAGRLREKLGIDPETFLIGFIGRLTAIKDPLLLLHALAGLQGMLKRPTALMMVGEGELSGRFEAEAERLGLADRVHRLGWQKSMAEVYAALDVLALTSRNEGLPLVLIEALAAGRPVVATNVGGVPSLLGLRRAPTAADFAVGERGLVFNAGDLAGLLKALMWLGENKSQAADLAAAGRRYVNRCHEQERFLQAHAELYEAVSGRGR